MSATLHLLRVLPNTFGQNPTFNDLYNDLSYIYHLDVTAYRRGRRFKRNKRRNKDYELFKSVFKDQIFTLRYNGITWHYVRCIQKFYDQGRNETFKKKIFKNQNSIYYSFNDKEKAYKLINELLVPNEYVNKLIKEIEDSDYPFILKIAW